MRFSVVRARKHTHGNNIQNFYTRARVCLSGAAGGLTIALRTAKKIDPSPSRISLRFARHEYCNEISRLIFLSSVLTLVSPLQSRL